MVNHFLKYCFLDMNYCHIVWWSNLLPTKVLGEESYEHTFIFCHPEIWKLPQFEVEVPQDCLNRWSIYYEEYRKEMTDAMKIDDRDVKNQATNEIKRNYKMVISLLCPFFFLFFFLSHWKKPEFHFPALANYSRFNSYFMMLKILKTVKGILMRYITRHWQYTI